MTTTKQNSNNGETLDYVRCSMKALCVLNSAENILYSYMLNRYWFFKKIGNEYYENIKDIAIATKQSERNIARTIKKLEDLNHIDVYKKKIGTGNSNAYVVHDLYMLYTERPTSKTDDVF